MNSRTKFFIGILVIGIVLIGGWWGWSSQIKPIEPEPISKTLQLRCCTECKNAFNKSPIGVGSEMAKCGKFGTAQPISEECKTYFRNNPTSVSECKNIFELNQITIATDKTEYEQGEEIEIKLTNLGNIDFEIEVRVGSCHDFQVYDLKNRKLQISEPNCELYEIYREPYSIYSGETKIIGMWDQTIYENGQKEQVASGKYKIKFETIYSNEFTIKEKQKK